MTVRESEVRQVIFPDVATNRIEAAAARLRERIAKGVKPDGSPITADLGELDESMAVSPIEVFAYQNAQARAHATGKLSTAEAQTIYTALTGGVADNGHWSPHVDLALKVTITNVIGELLGGRR